MTLYVKCDRCAKEAAPAWQAGSGQQQQIYGYSEGRHIPPPEWNVIAGYTLCGDCVKDVLAVVHKAVAAKARP